MKRSLFAFALAGGLWAATAPHAETTHCDVQLNITDQDPAGLNVRASPGGAVIAAVKAKNRWVQVEVTGQSGAWARIKSATLYSDEDAGGTLLWKGSGWVAFSKLGIDHFDGRTRIRTAPSEDAKVLLSLEGYDDSTAPPAEAILGCDHYWLKVRVKGVVGWTNYYCSNELTTCV
jgi:SH3-like domain-containing protein